MRAGGRITQKPLIEQHKDVKCRSISSDKVTSVYVHVYICICVYVHYKTMMTDYTIKDSF